MTSNYPFVSKLYSMLTDTENSAFISWSPDGGAFFVWNPTEFSASVLPKYFKHNNFCSFVRQLNIYGFHKVENENWMFTHDEKLFQRDAPESIAKIQRRRQTKRSGSSNADESEDYIAHMPPTKKQLDEPSFAAPVSIVHTPVSTTLPTKPSPHHMPLMSPHSHSHSTPMTPATPAGNSMSMTTTTSSFQAMMTPNSVSMSSASSIDDDIAYLKTMNGMLVSELSQMKRKTQSQEDTITWLIQELARTQRHVEMISSGSQPSQTSTPSQPPAAVLSALGSSNSVEITAHLPGHSSHHMPTHVQAKLKMELSDSTAMYTPHTPGTNSGLVYTPQSTSSTASYHYDPNTNSGLSTSAGMPSDFSDPFQFQDSNSFVYGEEAPLI